METTLRNIISDIRGFIYGGAIQLPLTLAGTFLIIGFFTANYAMLFFLFGFLILVPFSVQVILNPTFGWILTYLPGFTKLFGTIKNNVCGIMPSFKTVRNGQKEEEEMNVFSTWTAMISFFIGYILTNAVSLLNHSESSANIKFSTAKTDENAEINPKKTISVIATYSIVMLIISVIFLFFVRTMSSCETIFTTIISIALFTYFGHGWYLAISSMGEERVSDLFGIVNRILPPSAITNGPIACIPLQTN